MKVGMTREQRAANLRDSFKVPRSRIKGQRLLLVDDVITTADECARVLLNHGARSTDILTLARTVRRI
jgi:predicted amidophosphoribosyltransferase